MAKISFYGAAGTVTGSRHLLDIRGQKLLIDCGLFQGKKENRLKNWEPFPVSPAQIDRVLLTHAHIDHTGYLPRFCRDGFDGPVHCTYATRDLCELLLRDSAHLQEEDARWANKKGFSKHKPAKPLYGRADAEKALEQLQPLYPGEALQLDEQMRVRFRDAGHILGASTIDIKVRGKKPKKILFSGDLGRANELILREPVQVYNVDYLVLESTYGNRAHEEFDPRSELIRIVNESVQRGGMLVIPAFSVGRTQMLLYMLRDLEDEGLIPSIPIFIDSPMAIDATKVFSKHISDLNFNMRIQKLKGKRIFSPDKLYICKKRQESKAINSQKGPGIIISASGMATGGRILHHLVQRLPKKENTILFVGYQAEGTRGRTILDGNESVKIHGRRHPINATVERISGFSGHSDYYEILAWLMAFNRAPKEIFLVHGEPEAAAGMAEKIEKQFGWKATIPSFGDSFDLDI